MAPNVSLVEIVDGRLGHACVGAGGIWEISMPFSFIVNVKPL